MLVDLNDVLVPARKGKYAVGLFNTVNLELARGAMEAVEELDSPIIIRIAEVLLLYGPLEDLASPLTPVVERASAPMVVHLDHGLREEICRLALELGFSSIMYDCFTMGYGDNMEYVKKMAETAHSFGASTEVELSHVGDNEGGSAKGSSPGAEPSQFYTGPVQTRNFIDRTGADALAVAVDTVHGAYKPPSKLDPNRILEITEAISTPLVPHSGPGLFDSDSRTAVERGISKASIFTDINQAGARAAGSGYKEGIGLTDTILPEIKAVKRSVMEEMGSFGSTGQESGRQ